MPVETTVDACVTTASVKLGGNCPLQSTLHAPSAVSCHTSRRSAAKEGLYLKEKRKLVELEHVHGMECAAQQAELQEVRQCADQLSAKWQARCERQTQAAKAQKRIASEHQLLAAQHKQRAGQVAAALQDTQIKLHGSEETCVALQIEHDAVRHELAHAVLMSYSLSCSTLQLSRKHPWTSCSKSWPRAKHIMFSSERGWLSWVRVLIPHVGCDAACMIVHL